MSAFIDSGHDRGWWILAALSYFETLAVQELHRLYEQERTAPKGADVLDVEAKTAS
jgi:hypothetical protein